MSADRELLELAAKAVGLKYHAYVDSDIFGRGINIGEVDVPLWNPLTDDGAALRLAVALRMTVAIERDHVYVVGEDAGTHEIWTGADPVADARRAIVCAAAEVAKAMP